MNTGTRISILLIMAVMLAGCQTEYLISADRQRDDSLLAKVVVEKLGLFLGGEGFRRADADPKIFPAQVATWTKIDPKRDFWHGQAWLYVCVYKEGRRVIVLVKKEHGRSGLDKDLAVRLQSEVSEISTEIEVTISHRTVCVWPRP